MSKPKTFEEWDTNVRPGLPRFRDAGRSDRRSAWNAAREALMAELLEAEKTYPEDPSRVIEWCAGVGGSSWYVSVELLRALTGLVARLRGDLSESRAESAALRKKVEDLLAHAQEVEDQRNDLQERWSYEYDEAQRLRKRLAEVEVELSHFRNRTQGAEAALSVVAGDDASKAEDLDALRTHFGISEGEDVVEGVKARFALTEESSGRAKKVDQDALANVIENSRLIGSQYDADRLAEKIVEWLEGRDG